MSLRKVCFYTMLAAILACAATGRLNRHSKKFDVPEANAGRSDPSLAASFRPKSEMLPADFLPVQSKNAKSLGAGKLLVASRNLGDPHFAKTVILLARYDAQGALGLTLNRRTDVPLSRVLESPKTAKDRSDPVYLGGPLEMPTVFALFQSPAKLEGAEHVFDRVYLIAAKPLFEQTLAARPDAGVFHVYVGYAGWTQDQLRMEVELGAWFIFPAEASMVFNADPDSLWLEMIRKTELQLARSESVMTNKAILQPLLWSITPRGAGHDTSFVSFAHSSILRKMLARPGEVVPREEHSGPTGPTKNRFRFVYFGDAVTSWPTAQAPSG